MRPGLQTAVLFAILAGALLLTACSTGSLNTAPAPVFTNTPGTSATEGSTYTYQIQSQPGTGVTFTLGTAPPGAVLAGNTITWTPTAAQSRVPNQFSVTAATSGGSTTQFWSVTPAGTVSGTWIDTEWTANGPTPIPFDWTKSACPPGALVPQPDGTFQALQGSGNSDGAFSIPIVPGGYYWLVQPQLSVIIQPGGILCPAPGAAMYWTSSSTIDLGHDFGSQTGWAVSTNLPATHIQVDYAGLDPLQAGEEVGLLWPSVQSFLSQANSPAGATTFSIGPLTSGNFNLSLSGPAFLLQYEPETFGTLSALRLGPAETIPSPAYQIGTSNTINATLAPSPVKSFDLSIKGSAWPALFNNAAPAPVTIQQAHLTLAALPFTPGNGVAPVGGLSVPLLDEFPQDQFLHGPFASSSCLPSGLSTPPSIAGEPPITTDQDFGTVSYGDPFPSNWQRVFTFCQTASITFSGSTNTSIFPLSLVDAQSTAVPTSQITPLIAQVQNPTINGASLFQPNTIASTGVTLNWAAPNGTAPTGY